MYRFPRRISRDGLQPAEPQLHDAAGLHAPRDPLPAGPVPRPEARQVRRLRAAAAEGQEHRDHLREDVDPDARLVRGRGLRPGRPRDLPRAERDPDRPQGVDEGHRPGPRPDLRRDRVPRLRPGDRRRAGQVRRRAGLERADRRVPPDPDPRRRPDDDRVLRQAAQPDLVLLSRRRPQQHGRLAADRWLEARDGRAAVRPEAPLAGRGPRREVPGVGEGVRRADHPDRGHRRGRQGRRLPVHRRLGLDGRGHLRLG